MAMFPALELEAEVQVNDKTRLSGTKSFVSKGETAITTVTITPGATGSAVTVSGTGLTSDDWYTDWQWTSWSFDIDSTNNKIDIEEGGSNYVATVSTSTYTSVSSLVSAIQTALNLAGASGTFTVTTDELSKITIASTVAFKLLPHSGDNRLNGLLKHVGFDLMDDTDSSLSQVGMPVEYGMKKVTLSVNNGTGAVTIGLYQKVYLESGDRLFSTDSDMERHEEDIRKWVPLGRSSFKDIHRRAQAMILDWISQQGYVNSDRKTYTKWDLYDLSQVKEWATFLALQLIFEGNSNAVDDVFDKKAKKYASMALASRNRFLAIDIDQDGKIDFDENLRLHVGSIFRR